MVGDKCGKASFLHAFKYHKFPYYEFPLGHAFFDYVSDIEVDEKMVELTMWHIATKKDLRTDPETNQQLACEKKSVVSPKEGRSLAERVGAWSYLECSAKTGEGVREVFDNATKAALQRKRRTCALL